MGPEGLTPELFSELVGVTVVDVRQQRIGTGLVGMNVRCALAYSGAPPEGAPRSLVAKLPSPDPVSRAAGIATRTYERESKFYAHVAPTVRIRIPRCWLNEWDEATGDCALVLEDLAPAEPGDQIAGCTVDQARVALRELARLHGPRWGDERLGDLDWLSRARTDEDRAQLQAFYAGCLRAFAATYERHLTPEQLDLAERFADRVGEWAGGSRSPHTVTHGDFRVDNLLFATAAGGDPVAAVDWQTPGHGPAAMDVAYFLGGSLPLELRRRHERALVEQYLADLRAEGIGDVRADDVHEDYRRCTFSGVVMTVIASTIVGTSDRSEAMFAAMATRHLQHALDLDAWSMIAP